MRASRRPGGTTWLGLPCEADRRCTTDPGIWRNGRTGLGRGAVNVREIVAAVLARRASAVEIVGEALDRIAAAKPLNAIVTVDIEHTLAEAATIDRRTERGDDMPLAGVPVVVKDNIWVEG